MRPFSTGIYKKIDNLKFKETLNRELMKHDLNNIDYENFHDKIVLSIFNAHAPLKKSNTLEQITLFSWLKSSYEENKAKKRLLLKNELEQLKQLAIISETFLLVFLGIWKGLILKTLM